MAEIGKKKRRIARVGGISGDKEATQLHSDDGGIQADCNLVYNIMQSMNKSQNVMSYSQLQEYRSKEKASRTINSDLTSSKQSSKVISSKQIKKFVPQKTFPLMEKCQKNMKYLKKNRCIPKPRAHVGSILRPTPNPISNLLPNNISNNSTVLNNKSLKDSSVKPKHSIKPSKPEKRKKAKISHSPDNPSEKNNHTIHDKIASSHKESCDEKSKVLDSPYSDSDSDFEQFLQKHQPEKSVRRKSDKSNKLKRKKNKKYICAKKFAKVTSRALSASEDSAESEGNSNENKNSNEEPSNRFQRIVEYENSDSENDTHINDLGTSNCGSFSSSEDENMNSSLCKENRINFNDLPSSSTTSAEQRSIFSSSTSSVHKDPLCDDALKSLCKTPCYVVIKRDSALDEKAAWLRHAFNSVQSSIACTLNPYDEDDCIIIETSTNNANQISDNIAPSIEKRNVNQDESTFISKSPHVSEASNVNDVQAKYTLNQEQIILKSQTETKSNEKAGVRSTTSRKSLDQTEGHQYISSNKGNGQSFKDANSIESEARRTSFSLQASDSANSETNVSLNCDKSTEKDMFNVQILSVKSLNDPDIIVLSDHEEKDTEAVPTANKTEENVTEDSDVEIICLDSSVNEEKCASRTVSDVMKTDTHNKIDVGMKENSTSSRPLVSIEDDCMILDDSDLPNENTSPPKNVGKVQQSSQVVNVTNNEKTNSNESAETSSGKALDSTKNSIFKILETIDFNCINKVLNETSADGSQKVSIPAKVENTLRNKMETSDGTPVSFPDKVKQSQSAKSLSQKQTLINTTINPSGPFEVNIKISNTTPVDISEKSRNLVQNSNVLLNKSTSENAPSLLTPNSVPSSMSCNKSFTGYVDKSSPKSNISVKKVASSCKTEPQSLIDLRTNKQLLPVCTKVDSFESPSDELDIIAAKSIQSLNDKEKESIEPLIELYRSEYKRYMEIKSTEQNVTAGLKLLEDKQAKRLLAISSSIKNIVKKDECFHKIKNESGSKTFIKSYSVEKDEIKPSNIASQPSMNICPDMEKDDKVRIFNKSIVEKASQVLKSDGPSSSQEVYNHLINSVCAECGKHAVAACSGCAKVFFCSEKCGLAAWEKGHFATCIR